MMTADEMVKRNIELGLDFAEFLLEHPKLLSVIPDEARIVLLPLDDPEACERNLQLAEQAIATDEKLDRPVVYILRIPTEQEFKPVFVIMRTTAEHQMQLIAHIRSLVTIPNWTIAIVP